MELETEEGLRGRAVALTERVVGVLLLRHVPAQRSQLAQLGFLRLDLLAHLAHALVLAGHLLVTHLLLLELLQSLFLGEEHVLLLVDLTLLSRGHRLQVVQTERASSQLQRKHDSSNCVRYPCLRHNHDNILHFHTELSNSNNSVDYESGSQRVESALIRANVER